MAEMLNYAPDLRSITGGRGEYTMEFARYEEVPAHLAREGGEQLREKWTTAERPASSLTPQSGPMKQKVNISDRAAGSLRRLPHDAQGRARRALPDAVAGAAWCASCARPARSTKAGSARRRSTRDARAPAAPARAPRLAARRRRSAPPEAGAAPPDQGGAEPAWQPPGRRRERAGACAAAPARQPPPREGRADERPAQDRPRARAVQRLGAPAHGRRHGRTLGSAVVGPTSTSVRGRGRADVAWELSWYQFDVDLSDGREPRAGAGPGASELRRRPARSNGRIAAPTARTAQRPPRRTPRPELDG